VRASFLPGPAHKVADKLDRLKLHEIDLTAGRGAGDRLRLHRAAAGDAGAAAGVAASANPKSSTGRLDIFTRVMTDNGQEFDKIPAGYAGPLYMEVSPRTFPIVVRTGSRLSQIRFRTRPGAAVGAELARCMRSRDAGASRPPNISGGGIALSIDLMGGANGLIGYRGKHHSALIDVDKRAAHDALDFWEPLYNRGDASN
jgi:dCTP deaminase